MSKPVAKQADRVTATDTHLVIPEGGGSPVPTPLPFDGALDDALASTVLSQHRPVAVVGTIAHQSPGHIVTPKTFQREPSNKATVVVGSSTVLAENKALVRNGDAAETCNDPVDQAVGKVIASGTVLAGG